MDMVMEIQTMNTEQFKDNMPGSTVQTKVYCGQCRWYRWHRSQGTGPESKHSDPPWDECKHVANIKWVDRYAGRYTDKAWTPSEKNAANDCSLHEPKPPRQGFWSRVAASLTYTKMDRPRGQGIDRSKNV